jgi:hypothetical protein
MYRNISGFFGGNLKGIAVICLKKRGDTDGKLH